MSRWSGLAMLSLKRSLRVAVSGGGYGFSSPSPWDPVVRGQYCNSNSKWFLFNRHLCVGVNPPKGEKEQAHKQEEVPISMTEAKKLMRLVNVESLKRKLDMEGREVIGYSDLIESCKSMGVAKSVDEATAFVELLDQAGVILLFRDKVYLHPDKVVDMVRRAVPLALAPEDDPRRDELNALQMKKQEIDRLAHRQVRNILWAGLGFSVLQVGLFFRLTFWEFSWDVMEPIAFFTTTTGLVVGYAYFLFTSRDPSYQDLMERLYLSRQRKLVKKQNFDIERFVELQRHCKSPLEHRTSSKSAKGDDNDIDDHALHSDRSTTPRSL